MEGVYRAPFGGEPEPDVTNFDTLIDEVELQAALLSVVGLLERVVDAHHERFHEDVELRGGTVAAERALIVVGDFASDDIPSAAARLARGLAVAGVLDKQEMPVRLAHQLLGRLVRHVIG